MVVVSNELDLQNISLMDFGTNIENIRPYIECGDYQEIKRYKEISIPVFASFMKGNHENLFKDNSILDHFIEHGKSWNLCEVLVVSALTYCNNEQCNYFIITLGPVLDNLLKEKTLNYIITKRSKNKCNDNEVGQPNVSFLLIRLCDKNLKDLNTILNFACLYCSEEVIMYVLSKNTRYIRYREDDFNRNSKYKISANMKDFFPIEACLSRSILRDNLNLIRILLEKHTQRPYRLDMREELFIFSNFLRFSTNENIGLILEFLHYYHILHHNTTRYFRNILNRSELLSQESRNIANDVILANYNLHRIRLRDCSVM